MIEVARGRRARDQAARAARAPTGELVGARPRWHADRDRAPHAHDPSRPATRPGRRPRRHRGSGSPQPGRRAWMRPHARRSSCAPSRSPAGQGGCHLAQIERASTLLDLRLHLRIEVLRLIAKLREQRLEIGLGQRAPLGVVPVRGVPEGVRRREHRPRARGGAGDAPGESAQQTVRARRARRRSALVAPRRPAPGWPRRCRMSRADPSPGRRRASARTSARSGTRAAAAPG